VPSAPIDVRHSTVRNAENPTPPREIEDNEDYPAVIELRNGAVFSVTSYWLEGNNFHFITTRFDHYQIPFELLLRLFPHKGSHTSSSISTALPEESPQRNNKRK